MLKLAEKKSTDTLFLHMYLIGGHLFAIISSGTPTMTKFLSICY